VTVVPERNKDDDVLTALHAEVADWRPRRVPNLVELTRPYGDSWQRPVALASGLGAAALAIVLVLSVMLVLLVPQNIGWAGVVKDHLTHMP
jgi:hypothetical protein